MPGAAFHSFYWQTQAAPPAAEDGPGQPGYAAWQTSIVVGTILLMLFQG